MESLGAYVSGVSAVGGVSGVEAGRGGGGGTMAAIAIADCYCCVIQCRPIALIWVV